MSREVVFTQTAKTGIRLVSDYLIENWSIKAKTDFISKFEKSVKRILKFPNSNVSSKVINVKKCLVTKHTSFYYKITDEEVIIVAIIDNRMLKNDGMIN